MATALAVVGLVLALIGSIMVLIAAFQESVVWGLGILVVPFLSLVFVFTHWEDTKKAFLLQVLGIVIFAAGIFVGGGRPAEDMPMPGERPRARQIEIPD
jgi:hypothetical protein